MAARGTFVKARVAPRALRLRSRRSWFSWGQGLGLCGRLRPHLGGRMLLRAWPNRAGLPEETARMRCRLWRDWTDWTIERPRLSEETRTNEATRYVGGGGVKRQQKM